jgi:hypothetical protein
MSIKFERFLKTKFGNAYIKEQSGLFGVPDYIFYSRSCDEIFIVSFELKLRDWKQAAIQAFRYMNFSNISYVVLPHDNVSAAAENVWLFKKYNIGLASFGGPSDLDILYKPEHREPYSRSLNSKVLKSIKTSKKKSRNVEFFI